MENRTVVTITRRDFIAFAAGTLVAGGAFWLRPGKVKPIDIQELHLLVNELMPPKRVRLYLTSADLAKADFVQELHDNVKKGLQSAPTLRSVIDSLINRDYEANKVLFIKGWAMTHTEIALCLLS